MVRERGKKEEKIWNIPNILTLSRILITFAIVYLVFAQFNFIAIAVLFALGMITDFLDGQIARRFGMKTEFGAKFDMIADRFLMIGTALVLVIEFMVIGVLTRGHMLMIFIILTREIITFPFAIMAFVSNRSMPPARFIGKLTTCLQGFALPAILLSIYYPFFSFAPYLAGLTAVTGIVSAFTYIKDLNSKNLRKR